MKNESDNREYKPTRKEYFIAAAITGLASSMDVDSVSFADWVAHDAIKIANAVIEELDKGKSQ